MKKVAIVLALALSCLVSAQSSNDKPFRLAPVQLTYQPILDYRQGLSLPWDISLDNKKTQPKFVWDFRFGGGYDPFRTWQGRRVGYREKFGSMFKSDGFAVEFSSGTTSVGSMKNLGFEIRW